MIKKILITGGSGFVGGHLAIQATKRYEVHAISNKNPIQIKNIHAHQFDLYQVAQIENLLNDINPDVIIHTAAIANPDRCEDDPDSAIMVNMKATEELAKWAEKNGIRFIFTSTDMVFDGAKGNYKESDLPNPISFYSQTKVTAEEFITKNNSNYVIARVALVYGMGITRQTSFFEKMIKKLKNGESITLFYDQFRSPILVNNLAEALLELVENDFVGIIHLGGSERISRWEFGLKTCEILNLSSQNIVKGSMFDFAGAAFRPRDISLVNDLAKRVLNAKLLDFREGLERIRKDYKYK
jgi:dTDP-4-dehydrorhamnose reductase